MTTIHIQTTPWHTRVWQSATRSLQSAGSSALGVGKAAYTALGSAPKAIKIPLEAALISYSSDSWSIKGALTAAALWAETPKELTSFLMREPANLLGERFQLFGTPFPTDPKAPLTEVDAKINAFERAQPPIADMAPVQMSPSAPAIAQIPKQMPLTISGAMEQKTDENLTLLIDKVTYLSGLKTLYAFSGLPDPTAANSPLMLVDEASKQVGSNKTSLWKLFVSKYGSQMSAWGKIKARFAYLFLWKWMPVIQNTVDSYMKNMLSELRVHLKENGEKRKKFINGILEDADNFLEVFNGAAETYAHDKARKGNINTYRKAAVEAATPGDEITDPTTTPKQIKMIRFQKLSQSIVDNFSPTVPFGSFQWLLNKFIKKALRESILPEALASISEESEEATKRHNIPFFLALTTTLTQQIADIQKKLKPGATDPDSKPLVGSKNFESLVKKLLSGIEIAGCKTPEETRAKLAEIQNRDESELDTKARKGIQEGIQKGLAIVFDYLSKQENTEELFALLFESVAEPLSGKLPMTDQQWTDKETEYENAKILLKESASTLFQQVVKEAVQDEVRGGASPEMADRVAKRIFAEHQTRAQGTFEELRVHCDLIREKVRRSKDLCTEDTSILPELGAIASTLKAYENKERVKITLQQDPPPPIAQIPPADRESILRVLHPVYEGSNQIMDRVLRLQELQKNQAAHNLLAQDFRHIKKVIDEIVERNAPASSTDQIGELRASLAKIEKALPGADRELRDLKEQIHALCRSVEHLAEEQVALDALKALQPFPQGVGDRQIPSQGLIGNLVLCIHGNPPTGFKKWKCIEQIKEQIKLITKVKDEQEQIADLVERINKYNTLPHPRPNFEQEIWLPLAAKLQEHKLRRERNQKRYATLVDGTIPKAHKLAGEREAHYEKVRGKNWSEMDQLSDELQRNTEKLLHTIERSEKEAQLRPTPQTFGQVGGVAGSALGAAFAAAGPAVGGYFGSKLGLGAEGSAVGTVLGAGLGGMLGAGVAYSVRNLDNLALQKGGALAYTSFASMTGGATASLLAYGATSAALPPLAPILIGAAATAAGTEYAGAKLTDRMVDTGIQLVYPKVNEIFEKSYEHILMNDIVINGAVKILMKQVLATFPPKK